MKVKDEQHFMDEEPPSADFFAYSVPTPIRFLSNGFHTLIFLSEIPALLLWHSDCFAAFHKGSNLNHFSVN